MSPNHPNRSRRKPAPGRNPSYAEIRSLRESMGLTQTDFGALIYAGLSTVQAWEDGTRRMQGLTWEYINLLWEYPEVERARMLWISKHDSKMAGLTAEERLARIMAR